MAGVITSLLTAWALGAEGRGDFAIIVLYPNIVALAVGLGMPQATRYFIASEPKKLPSLFSNAVCFALLMGVLGYIGSIFIVPLLIGHRSEAVMWLVRAYLINIPFALLYDMMAGLLEGSRRFKLAALSRMTFFGIQCVGYLLLWLTGHLTIANAALTMVLAQFANTSTAFLSVLLVLKPGWKPSFRTFKETLVFGLKYHAGVVTSFTTLRLDQIMLGGMATSLEMGLYVIAVRLSEIMTVLASSLSEVLMPEVAASKGERSIQVLMRSLRQTLYVYLLMIVPLLVAAPLILRYAFGSEFLEASSSLRILIVASMVWSAGSIINSGLNGLGFPGLSTLSRLASAMITVITLLVWLPRFGIIGAAMSSLAGYTAMLVVALFWLMRKKKLSLPEIFWPRKNDIPMKELTSFLGWPAAAVATTSDPERIFVQQLFERQAADNPERIAITSKNGQMTYGELNERANQLAWFLRSRGAGPETLIPICVDRSADMAIGIFGILKSGAAYVPVDPSYPKDRIDNMLAETEATLVVTQSHLLEACGLERICLDGGRDVISRFPTNDPPQIAGPENLAYVIFTSGSTGRPKGVMLTNSNLAHYVEALQNEFRLTASDTYLHLASIGFSSSRRHLLLPLAFGAGVVIADEDQRLDPLPLFELIKERGVTVFDAVPSFQRHCLHFLLELDPVQRGELLCNDLRLIVSASEPLYSDIPRTWINDFGHPAEHVHMMGQTETSGIVALNRIGEIDIKGEVRSVSVGRPIANTEILLLDEHQRPVADGETGEMYVLGAGVGRGYLGLSELTTEKYVDLTIPGRPSARYCRTGDFARIMNDGRLECIGRNDFQVKIRGNRVELGEIEALFLGHESIRNCAVIGREDVPGDVRLVAYIVTSGESSSISEELRRLSVEALPDYMQPSAFVLLDSLPLTPNGKVDRKALPVPDVSMDIPDCGPVETSHQDNEVVGSIAAIWSEILGVSRVRTEDNFFALGGHSLMAGRMISRVRSKLGVQVPIRAIFEAPTLGTFSDLVERNIRMGSASTELAFSKRPEHLPLSFAQQRIWFLSELDLGLTAYNECEILKLSGDLDRNALTTALRRIVERHEVLRTYFGSANGQPCQVIVPEVPIDVKTIDLTVESSPDTEDKVLEIARGLADTPFDLTQAPLFNFTLVQTGHDKHFLIAVLHHTVSDQWTVAVFLRELDAFYRSEITGSKADLPELPIQYADYAVLQQNWLLTDEYQKQLSYWKEQLRGAPNILELPTDHPRPAVQSYRGSKADASIPSQLVDKINAFCNREGVTLFMTLLAAWELLLFRYSGQDQLVVGTPIAGRTFAETEDLIGFFVNTLAIRGDLSGAPTFRELLQRTKERALGAYTNQDLPFEKLVEEVNPERSLSYTPLFQVMFTLQNTPRSTDTVGDLALDRLRLPKESAKFDLSLDVFNRRDEFDLQLEFNTDLYEHETANRVLGHFRTILQSVVDDPLQRINTVQMLTESEQTCIFSEWNEQTVDVPPVCVHELIEAQAARVPDATAVICGDESLTYGELNERANQLAWFLQDKGVGPENIVGVYLNRSVDMIVTVLGVMKAGGAYLPMDPNYPLDRLRHMVSEAGVSVLLTMDDLRSPASDLGAETVVYLDRDRDAIAVESRSKPNSVVKPENLSYVTFTSGSTGKSKGVMIEHRNVVNAFEAWEDAYQLSSIASHLQMASFSFDVFTGDLTRALCSGATLILCPTELLLEPAEVYKLLSEYSIEAAEFVPAVIRPLIQYLETQQKRLDLLKLMVVGSDTWQSDEYRRLQRVCGANTRVINSYGVTEATIDSTFFEMAESEAAGAEFVPIGRPFANTQIYLLDIFGNPVPVGVPGELYQGGNGLARGYLNRPDLTSEKFVEIDLPFPGGAVCKRLYRTGDLARYRGDGNIAIIGRADNQVKLRGYRIELGEIESVLSRHPGVDECVVALREDIPGDKRLVAYLTTSSGTTDPAGLRTFLKGSLPEYMVPAAYVFIKEWKLTPSGKIDRKQLPEPEGALTAVDTNYVAPRTATEETMVSIWAELLRIDRVGVNDNFFELGGHSLLATQAVSRIRDFIGCEIPLRVLFETPTIAAIATRIDDILGTKAATSLEASADLFQSTEDEQELERLLAELESVSDEEADQFLAQMDEQYSEAHLGNK